MSLPLVIFQKNVHFQFRYSWLCCSASPSNSILGSSIKHRIKALSFYCLPSLRLLCWFFPFNFNSDCTTNDGGGGFTCRYLPRRVSKAYGTKQGLCFADSSPTRNILSLPLIGLRLRSAFCTLHFRSLPAAVRQHASMSLSCVNPSRDAAPNDTP